MMLLGLQWDSQAAFNKVGFSDLEGSVQITNDKNHEGHIELEGPCRMENIITHVKNINPSWLKFPCFWA